MGVTQQSEELHEILFSLKQAEFFTSFLNFRLSIMGGFLPKVIRK